MSFADYPPVEFIRQCFEYNDGKIFWKVRPLDHFNGNIGVFKCWNTRHSGSEAGTVSLFNKLPRHYIRITYDGEIYKIFRYNIVWVLHNDNWPEDGLEVDHQFGDTLDDRIEFLRLANFSQRGQNKGKQSNNTSGYPGVCYDKSRYKYMAYLNINGKSKMIGRYNTAEEANEARIEVAREVYGEFYREHELPTEPPGDPPI